MCIYLVHNETANGASASMYIQDFPISEKFLLSRNISLQAAIQHTAGGQHCGILVHAPRHYSNCVIVGHMILVEFDLLIIIIAVLMIQLPL